VTSDCQPRTKNGQPTSHNMRRSHLQQCSEWTGRSSCRLAVTRHAQPQHVHTDRHGDRRRVPLQRGSTAGARAVSAAFRGHDGGSPSISKLPPSSPCFGAAPARCSNCAHASRLRVRSRAPYLAPKAARRVREDGSDEEMHSSMCCRRPRRVRPGRGAVDGVLVEGRSSLDESMVQASRCRHQGDWCQVIGGTLNQSGSFVMRARRSGATPCSLKSCRWWRRRSAHARRSSAWPTRSRAGSCRA